MVQRTRIWVWFAAAALLLTPLAGCGGDDSDDGQAKKRVKAEKPIAGSFVGEVSGTDAFVAVLAEPIEDKKDSRVQVYVSDGRRVSEWFSGSTSGKSFVAKSDSGGAEAKGKLSEDSVKGTLELPNGKKVRYNARPPGGAAGLYDLVVSAKGKLRGASAAGLGLTGEVKLQRGGTGMLKLADGERLKFAVTQNASGDLARLRPGQVRLIVLPGGELRGAGKSRSAGGDAGFFIRSTAA
jgi:hypothetical protein